MPSRARSAGLALLALAAAVLVAWLLLRTGGAPGKGLAVPSRAPERGPLHAPVPPPAAVAANARPATAAEAAPTPAGPSLTIRTEVEGGFPLSDVQVLPLERDPADGSLGAWIGDEAPDPGCTDRDGCITIRYTPEPRERLFGLLEDREIVRVENAEPAGTVHRFKAFRAKSTDPVRFVYRDPEGQSASTRSPSTSARPGVR